jgi:hypothetical protein
MKQKKTLSFCLFILFAISTNAQVKLDIDASKTGITISPMEYGIFFEDINHAADGGLYAELIRNRSFEDQRTVPEGWSLSTSDNNRGELSLISKGLLNSAQKQALKISIPKGTSQANPISLFNEGFWGINVVKGRTYKLTFWAKTDGNYKGELIAGLAYDGGEICKKVEGTITKKWQKFSVEITADANDAKGRFVLKFNSPGTVCLDVVSLMPPTFKNHPNGCRPELAQLLYDPAS